jgi:hypothetical protein
MISRCFEVNALDALAVHADPIAALDALKLVSLVVTRGTSVYLALRAALQLRKTAILPFCQSTHSHRYGFPSRTARDKLDSAHHSRSL